MVHLGTTSSSEPAPLPLYVVYGYRRDADEFARERGIRREDVLAVTEGTRRLQGIRRPVILVDTDHVIHQAMRWYEATRAAEFINKSMGLETETIRWVRS